MTYWLNCLRQQRAIAVIRAPDAETATKMAVLCALNGLRSIELTWNTPEVALLFPQLQKSFPHCWFGAGTILSPEAAAAAIAGGAQFLFTPHLDPAAIAIAQSHHIPIVAGALTPTEILAAWRSGATAVKVFPIQAVGGPAYLRALRPVFPDIPLIPTGGITVENTAEFLAAGAFAVGMASNLFAGDWQHDGQARCRLLLQQVANVKDTKDT